MCVCVCELGGREVFVFEGVATEDLFRRRRGRSFHEECPKMEKAINTKLAARSNTPPDHKQPFGTMTNQRDHPKNKNKKQKTASAHADHPERANRIQTPEKLNYASVSSSQHAPAPSREMRLLLRLYHLHTFLTSQFVRSYT